MGRDLAAHQGHHMTGLALLVDPALVMLFADRVKTQLQALLGDQGLQVLEHCRDLLGVWNLHQKTQRQNAMDGGLTDVENIHTIAGQYTGNGRSETRTVLTGDVYQDDFAQGTPPFAKKNAFYPLSVTIGHRQGFAASRLLAILRTNLTD